MTTHIKGLLFLTDEVVIPGNETVTVRRHETAVGETVLNEMCSSSKSPGLSEQIR